MIILSKSPMTCQTVSPLTRTVGLMRIVDDGAWWTFAGGTCVGASGEKIVGLLRNYISKHNRLWWTPHGS